jgi:hypothetical protein
VVTQADEARAAEGEEEVHDGDTGHAAAAVCDLQARVAGHAVRLEEEGLHACLDQCLHEGNAAAAAGDMKAWASTVCMVCLEKGRLPNA